MAKTILILGGYGNAGRRIADLLALHTGARLVIAGRNLLKAQSLAEKLNFKLEANRVTAIQADATDLASLAAAFAGCDLVLVASSTIKQTELVAEAAIDAGADYFDLQLSSPEKLQVLERLRGQIERAGRCFVTDGGFHPGMPAALIRYAAQHIEQLETANVASLIRIDWGALDLTEETILEFIAEMRNYRALALQEGKWRKARFNFYRPFDFGPPFGRVQTVPMYLPELHDLPSSMPALRECGFYVSGFNWFVDFLVLPAGMLLLKLFPRAAQRLVARWMYGGLRRFSKPPYATSLLLEAGGTTRTQRRTLRLQVSHNDAYVLTAVPVVACVQQLLDGSRRQPGLWLQGELVEPSRFMHDLVHLGLRVTRDGVPLQSNTPAPAAGLLSSRNG